MPQLLDLGGNLAAGTVNFGGSAANSETPGLTSATQFGNVAKITGFSIGDVIQLMGFSTAARAVESGGRRDWACGSGRT